MTDKMLEAVEKWCRGFHIGSSLERYADDDNIYIDWNVQNVWRAWQAAQSAAVPDGYQLVPIQPTPEMVDAVLRHANGNDLQFYGANELRKEIAQDWEMMLSAAQQ